MTVSTGGGVDLDAVVQGGPDFIKRLTDLQAATATHQKALADLNLGKEAIAARDEAARILAAAKEEAKNMRAKLEQEIAAARAEFQKWNAAWRKERTDILATFEEALR